MHIWRAPRRRQRVPRPQCRPTPAVVRLHVHIPTLTRSTAAGDPAAPVGPMDRPDAHGWRKGATRQPVRRCATCAEGAAPKVEVSRVAGGAGRRARKVVEGLIGSGRRGGSGHSAAMAMSGVPLEPSCGELFGLCGRNKGCADLVGVRRYVLYLRPHGACVSSSSNAPDTGERNKEVWQGLALVPQLVPNALLAVLLNHSISLRQVAPILMKPHDMKSFASDLEFRNGLYGMTCDVSHPRRPPAFE